MLAAVVFGPSLIAKFLDFNKSNPYNYARLQIWRSSLNLIAEKPILGVGFGQFIHASKRFNFPLEGHIAGRAGAQEIEGHPRPPTTDDLVDGVGIEDAGELHGLVRRPESHEQLSGERDLGVAAGHQPFRTLGHDDRNQAAGTAATCTNRASVYLQPSMNNTRDLVGMSARSRATSKGGSDTSPSLLSDCSTHHRMGPDCGRPR